MTRCKSAPLPPSPLGDDTEPLLGLALLLLLQLLGGLLAEESPQLLLPLGGHESLLLGHGWCWLLAAVTVLHEILGRSGPGPAASSLLTYCALSWPGSGGRRGAATLPHDSASVGCITALYTLG